MLDDVALGLRSPLEVETLGVVDTLHASLANIASFMVYPGYFVCLAALALAAYQAVQSRRRGWFALLLVCFALLFTIGTAPFETFIFDLIPISPELSNRIDAGSPPILTVAVYLGLTALTIAFPLATLLYGVRGSRQPGGQNGSVLATDGQTPVPDIGT